MSRIDDLVENYSTFVRLPWPKSVAPAQRVWMAVYPPDDERRLRLHVPAFEAATIGAGHEWGLIDITTRFEIWMSNHDYRDQYFEEPELLQTALPDFMDELVSWATAQLEELSTETSVVGLLGAGALFGLGDSVKLSVLVDRVQEHVQGRLLVLFPGEREGNNYRLLGARDGWNYLATPITAAKG